MGFSLISALISTLNWANSYVNFPSLNYLVTKLVTFNSALRSFAFSFKKLIKSSLKNFKVDTKFSSLINNY